MANHLTSKVIFWTRNRCKTCPKINDLEHFQRFRQHFLFCGRKQKYRKCYIFFADEQKYKNVNNLYFYKLNLNTSSFGTDTTREIKKFYNFLNLEMFYIFKNLKKGTKQKILIILNCVFWKLKQKFWAPNSEILPNLIKFRPRSYWIDY